MIDKLPIGSHRVSFSGDQWIVEKRTDPGHHRAKEGSEPTWRTVSYHSRLEHAMEWLLDREIGLGDPRDVLDVCHLIDRWGRLIRNACQDREEKEPIPQATLSTESL